jgi:rod shape-determining protein MreD
MRTIPYILYLLLIAFFRTSLNDLVSIGPVQIYLTALLVVLVGLHKSHVAAVWFGIAAGVVYDAPNPSFLGVHMLILSVIGALTAQIKQRFNLESVPSRMLLVLEGIFIYSIPYVLIYATSGTSEFFYLMLRSALPSVVYTGVIAWLFFMVQSGRLSYERIKSIF